MKHSYILPVLLVVLSFCINIEVNAQKVDSLRLMAKDTTPVELLDYKLSHEQFLFYYGVDDTARAMINMFFRKRQNAAVNFCLPIGTLGLLGLITDGSLFYSLYAFGTFEGVLVLAVTVYALRGVVQRVTYSRKTLLEVLVDRERGHPIPDQFYYKLKPVDFFYK